MSTEPTEPAADTGPGVDFTDPNSPLAPIFMQASHIVAAVLLLAIVVFFAILVPLKHSDVWMHLKYGQWICTHHALPDREPFSPFADPDQPIIDFMWLGQVTMYGTYSSGAWLAGGNDMNQMAGGVGMLRSMHGLLVGLKFLFLLGAYRRACDSLPLACFGIVVVLGFTTVPLSIQRPQVFGELCFAIVLFMLSRKHLSLPAVLLIPLTMTLWTNFHGSFPMGLALIGVVLAGRAREVFSSSWTAVFRDRQTWLLGIALALSTASSLVVNPYGFDILAHISHLSNNANIHTMEEWGPLDFTQGTGGHWTYLIILIVVALAQVVSTKSMSWASLFVVLLFGVIPLVQQRTIIWWLMLVPWVILPLLANVPQRWTQRLHYETVPSLRKTLFVGAFIVVVFMQLDFAQLLLGNGAVPIFDPKTGEPQKAVSSPTIQLIKVSKSLQADKSIGTVFTSEILGDYLVWSVPDKPRVFAYSHVQVFPEEHWRNYQTILLARSGWESVADRYGVNLFVIDPDLGKSLDDPESTKGKTLGERLINDPKTWQILVHDKDAHSKVLIAKRKVPLER